ncbi:hypothetical protein NP493_1380g00025 [Ridgeia piscesae]|uniref:Uncharacterized protein n=1 Tax=Ridgeia piscesae TaxID=27915 RepID=A0AAD9K5M2_RIDPI|nr:hypothetical protein NP493_1380g00025 [Ridgeia piscesae]
MAAPAPLASTDNAVDSELSKFARLARSVTRNRSVLVQFSSHVPSINVENNRPSQIANVSHVTVTSVWSISEGQHGIGA